MYDACAVQHNIVSCNTSWWGHYIWNGWHYTDSTQCDPLQLVHKTLLGSVSLKFKATAKTVDHILYYRDWTTHYFKGRFLNPVYLYEVLWKAVCSVSNRRCHHLASGRVDLLYHSLEKGGGGRKKKGMTKQDKFTQRSSALCAVSPLTIEQGAKGR